jgi:hypothetical protein
VGVAGPVSIKVLVGQSFFGASRVSDFRVILTLTHLFKYSTRQHSTTTICILHLKRAEYF